MITQIVFKYVQVNTFEQYIVYDEIDYSKKQNSTHKM